MRIESTLDMEQIRSRFYKNVRSEKEIGEYSDDIELTHDRFFFGDIAADGSFIIKNHVPQARSSSLDSSAFFVKGTVTENEKGTVIEYEFWRRQLPLEMLCAITIVCSIMFLLTVFKDVVAGLIMLAVMAIVVSFSLRNPLARKKLESLVKKIVQDK